MPDAQGLIVFIQVMHGICYAFFFATVYIFVDEHFPKDIRSSAQGLFNFMILGAGALVANSLCPYLIQEVFTNNKVTDFGSLFAVPLIAAVTAALVLLFFFHPPKKEARLSGAATPAH